jgi:Flp pilus assembly protein TadG
MFVSHLRRRTAARPRPLRGGTAVVELAIVLPVFLMIVLGIVEFGRAIMVGQSLTSGARHGARQAIAAGSTNSSVERGIKEFLDTTLDVAPDDLDIRIEVEPGPGNPDPADRLAEARAKDLVRVTVTVPFDRVAYVAGNFLDGATLRGRCAMRRESGR